MGNLISDEEIDELEAELARHDWAYRVIERAAFMHVVSSPECAGRTLFSDARVRCWSCGWRASALAVDDDAARGRFALLALAAFGLALGAAL